jgi:hypothetical protein
MKYLSQPFTDEKNQTVFLSLGLFWVTNIGELFDWSTLFSRLFFYPVYLILLLNFIYLLFNIRKNKNNFDKKAYTLLWFLIILGVVNVLRGISQHTDIDEIRALLFGRADSAMTWIMPVALLYGLKKQFWFTWLPRLRTVVVIGFVYVLTVMLLGLFARDITAHRMYNSGDFLFISAFLLIFSVYKSNKINIFIGCMGVILLTAHMFLHNERFAIAYIGLMCIFYLIFIILEQKRLDLKVYVFSIGSIVLLASFLIALNTPFFQEQIHRYFIEGEMWVDTRQGWGGVYSGGNLSEAVTRGMSTFELAFGRGILGEYTWGYTGWPPVLYVRGTVEIGFKQIILKGGYVMLACFLLMSIYAAYLGIFQSKNKITRYLAFIIIARLIIMSTAMIPRVGFEYFMYWLVVGGCLSPQLRVLDDTTIKNNCEINRRFVIRW